MRELKFRLIRNGNIVGYERWSVFDGAWQYSCNNIAWSFDFIQHDEKEQFTGLHDKNGVEIYEGDVVRYRDTAYTGPIVVGKDKQKVPIYYIRHPHLSATAIGEEITVIGDIRKNPELSKEGA